MQVKYPEAPESGFGYSDITSQAAILVFLALLPFIVMLLTSFLKMVITLALLRSALGVQQNPPNQVYQRCSPHPHSLCHVPNWIGNVRALQTFTRQSSHGAFLSK